MEYPAFGTASLSLYFTTDGTPLEWLRSDGEERETENVAAERDPSYEGPPDPAVDLSDAFNVMQKLMTFWIQAKPWAGDRPRPFASTKLRISRRTVTAL
jgi:hypothetical protein